MKKLTAKIVLQKYGKVIMTVMSILLMFIFALPTFRQKPVEPEGIAVGTLNGKKVTNDDMAVARAELGLIRNLRLFQIPQFGDTFSLLQGLVPDESEQPQYWYLLKVEASKYSTTIYSEADATQMINSMGLSAEETSPATLARVLSDLDTVENYLRFVFNQPRPITAYELLADKDLRKIQVNFARVDAIEGWEQAAAPTDDEMQKQFDAYKKTVATHIPAPPDAPYLLSIQFDPAASLASPYVAILGFPDTADKALRVHEGDTLPWDGSKVERISLADQFGSPTIMVLSGGGRTQAQPLIPGMDLQQRPLSPAPAEVNGHRFPFGYKYPDRVTVQYLVFNREEIRKTIPVTSAIVQRAYEAFKAIKDKSPAPAATAPASASAPASQVAAGVVVAPPTAASQPATASAPAPVTWEAMKDDLIKKEVDKDVDRLMKRMLDWVRNRTDAPFKNTDWKSTPPPEPKDWVDYAKLADDFARVGDFNKYKPLVKDTGEAGKNFLTGEKLGAAPGIGHAIYANSQGQVFTFSTMAANVGELVDLDKRSALARLNLHLGTEAPEVTDKDGNVYLFRVTSVDKTHEPASLTDDKAGVPDPALRQQVIDDCRKLAAYNRRVKEVNATLVKAEGGGVAAVAAQFKVDMQKPPEFNRVESKAPVDVQGLRDFIKTAFTLHDPKTPGSMTTLESDAILKCFPIELTRVSAPNAWDFGNGRPSLFGEPDPAMIPFRPARFDESDTAMILFVRSYFDVEALAGRLKYKPVNGFPKKTP